jgi:two-component system KDP operon response regulator KdpE
MASERVLIVDDEQRFRHTLAMALAGHGYEVHESADGSAAVVDFRSFDPDLVLLDLMLPDTDGVSVCRELRANSQAAIIVLSVIGDEGKKVEALDQGADDYLTKPFGTEELLARMRAAMRRVAPSASSETSFESGSLRILFDERLVFLDNAEVHLTPTEFNLLQLLVENRGRVLRHPFILRTIWGPEYETDTQVLRTFINQLRAKLKDEDRARPRFIRTEPGVGYRFVAPPVEHASRRPRQ